MPRRNRPRVRKAVSGEPRQLSDGMGLTRHEEAGDGEWVVRPVPGSQAVKLYRCPGCDHEIRIGVPHVVAWPADEAGSVTDRRHWHTACWQARDRRKPARRRW